MVQLGIGDDNDENRVNLWGRFRGREEESCRDDDDNPVDKLKDIFSVRWVIEFGREVKVVYC